MFSGMSTVFDLAVVGAGIVGLACARAAALRGLRVAVIDRDAQANGASVRNFGFITVTGQERGAAWNRARRTSAIWQEVAQEAGISILQRGLWMTTRRPEAVPVLEAFLQTEMGEGCEMLTPAAARARCSELAGGNVQAVLASSNDIRVESREAIPRVAAWLAERFGVVFLRQTTVLSVEPPRLAASPRGVGAGLGERFGVVFLRQTTVLSVEPPRLETSRGVVEAGAVVVCPGDDLVGLFAQRIARYHVIRCKLQMLRLASP